MAWKHVELKTVDCAMGNLTLVFKEVHKDLIGVCIPVYISVSYFTTVFVGNQTSSDPDSASDPAVLVRSDTVATLSVLHFCCLSPYNQQG